MKIKIKGIILYKSKINKDSRGFFKEIYIANTFIISESMKNIKHSLSSLSFIFLLVQKFKKWFC
jgi:dTDP-4-dehydrorhamnose 3,5-epimerase-like enzyme